MVPGANHFFENKSDELQHIVGRYLDMRMALDAKEREKRKEPEEGAEGDIEADLVEEPEEDSSGD